MSIENQDEADDIIDKPEDLQAGGAQITINASREYLQLHNDSKLSPRFLTGILLSLVVQICEEMTEDDPDDGAYYKLIKDCAYTIFKNAGIDVVIKDTTESAPPGKLH